MSVLLLLYLCRPDISLHHNKFFLDCLQIMWTIQPANTLNRAYHNLCQFSSNISSHLGEDRNSHRKNALQKVPLFDWSVWLGQEKIFFFWAVDAHLWVMLNFLSTNTAKSRSSINSWSSPYSCLGLFWGAGLLLGLVDQKIHEGWSCQWRPMKKRWLVTLSSHVFCYQGLPSI